MKLLLEIEDEKADFVMELLSNFKFIKTKRLSPHKVKVIEGIQEAVKEVNDIKAGKKKAKPLSDFLNEL